MSFDCNHDHLSVKNLTWAIFINVLLTVVQITAGILSRSLSLIADAVHNLSDAASLVVALVAEKISHWPKDQKMTYGYGRAQIIGAFINSLTLIAVAFYIVYEVIHRFLNPQAIDGWVVIGVASVALVIDLMTAKLTHYGSKHNINMRAAFIHNVTDAMASLVVIISGVLVVLFDFYVFDLLASLLISAYILYQSVGLVKDCLQHLMQAVPTDIDFEKVKKSFLNFEEVLEIKKLNIWSMNDTQRSLQAEIKIKAISDEDKKILMTRLKSSFQKDFRIQDSTLELLS